jgi:putative transposase
VTASDARERGYKAYKKISRRKRHIAVDTDGRLLAGNLTHANIADSTDPEQVLDNLAKRWSSVKYLFGDVPMTAARCSTRRPISTLSLKSCEACKART